MSILDVIDAINGGSTLDGITHLIDQFSVDVDEPSGELRLRAIHHAVFKDRIDCVKLLIGRGCDINARDQNGYTALHIAARYNHTEMANELISLGAHVDAVDTLGIAPLHLALQRGHFNCSDALLQHGADPNVFYKDIGYEIHMLPGIYSECLELLLSYGANPDVRDTKGMAPLHHATRSSNTLYAYVLLKNGADPDMLTQQSSPNLAGKTALQMAVFSESKSIVELLLLYGADANCRDEHKNTPLHHVASRSNIAVAKLLIDNGAILTARNALRYHPLHKACAAGADPTMSELLLDSGAFVNSTTSLLDTPVKCVLSHWQQKLDDLNRNANDNDGDVDPEVKMKQRDDSCVQQLLPLLDHGARITISNRQLDPFSVLQFLPSLPKFERTRALLLEASIEIRLANEHGITPSQYKTAEFLDVASAAANPVSLRQACRKAIRKVLGKVNLPETVKELQLPATLQSYLIYRTN